MLGNAACFFILLLLFFSETTDTWVPAGLNFIALADPAQQGVPDLLRKTHALYAADRFFVALSAAET